MTETQVEHHPLAKNAHVLEIQNVKLAPRTREGSVLPGVGQGRAETAKHQVGGGPERVSGLFAAPRIECVAQCSRRGKISASSSK